tara:strand:- start:36 stop:1055 length:1020 start_codon:yes stop_codon:yes gene_type:complete
MATLSTSISNDLLSSTLYSIRDGEVDELFQKVAFLDNAAKAGGMEKEDGGTMLVRPLSLVEHSSITELPTGYESVSLAVSDVLRPAEYAWEDFVAPIVISKKEELENQSEKAIVKIVEARMRSVMGMLRRELNKQILAGSSTVLTGMNTLNGDSAVTANGFFEGTAPPGQTNTVGNISKTTYATTTGWQNQYQTAGAAFGANGLNRMFDIYTACNSRAPMGAIDLVIASEASFGFYKRALQANERYIDQKVLDGGRMALAFAGAAVEQDVEMPVADHSMYFLNFDGIKLITHKDADFAVSPFESIVGTTARAAQLYWKGQLIADHLGSQGVLDNAEAWA